MKSSKGKKKAPIVDLMSNARFFVERGQRLLYRYDYERALRCFRRAVEIEPHNAGYYCQLASTLAEMGQFEASNEVLHHVLEHVDERMADIYFYLANNYANLEDFHMAEEMALKYLQLNETGVYAEEAEELLDYIYFELDMPPRRYMEPGSDQIYVQHETARRCLEEGRFLEAVGILNQIVEKHGTFLPALNNLSLAYYYIGEFDKALATIERTLEQEPGNLHALCNLAVLLFHLNRTPELVDLVAKLKKVKPMHFDHMYKLATTMGVLGQHGEAYQMYKRMIRTHQPHDPCTFHYAAISAYLTGRNQQATRWWQRVKQLDPHSGVADHYLRLVQEQPDGQHRRDIPYHYDLPQLETGPDRLNWNSPDDLKDNPMIRASLLWALQHGKDDIKQTVLQTLALIGDAEAETAIRQFCKTTPNPHFKKLALLALANMGAALPYDIGECAEISHTGKQETDPILDALMGNSTEAEASFRDWALNVWKEYQMTQTEPIQVRKTVAWVAALEYLYAKQQNRQCRQADVARKYEVSLSTLAKCIKAISALDLNKF